MRKIDTVIRELRGSQFLRSAPEDLIQKLAKQTQELTVTAGDKVFSKGDSGNAMYFLVDGRVKVHDNDIVLTRLGTGEVFGEVGALSSENRTATVTAETDCVLYYLEQDRFYDTLVEEPHAARSIIKALCERERIIIDEKTEHAFKNQFLEREMEIGRKIQSGFLPDTLPQPDNWQMTGTLLPAREVAGDFYDFYEIESLNLIAVVIGDVCDKGVGAALFMTLFRSLLRANTLAMTRNSDLSIPDLAAQILKKSISLTNDYIADTHGASSMFASVFFSMLDPQTGELIYINAGHESPVLIKSDGTIERLEVTGPVIGLLSGVEHRVESVEMDPGSLLLGYTDGVPEAKNEEGMLYGEDELLNLLSRGSPNVQALVTHIIQNVTKFMNGAKQYDDMTLVAVRRQAFHITLPDGSRLT